GILVTAALSSPTVKTVLGIDIDNESITHCKKTIKDKRARFKHSEFFQAINGAYDTMLCNPPYLPQERWDKDVTLYGGKEGQEFAERVVIEGNDHLELDGAVLIITSSHSNEKHFLETCGRHLLDVKALERKPMGLFETLTVWNVTKNDTRKELEQRGVKGLRFFAKGKRGMILVGAYKKKTIAIKIKNPTSWAVGSVHNEATMLQLVNKNKIGPRFVFELPNAVAYEFVQGTYLGDAMGDSEENEYDSHTAKALGEELLRQCAILDALGVQKEEMHNPHKNAIVTPEGNLTLIDFERAKKRPNPKNNRQALNYLSKLGLITKEEAIARGEELAKK
ncbi:MAG: methyltransferase, partial [Deltaproteobacteria bacterium]